MLANAGSARLRCEQSWLALQIVVSMTARAIEARRDGSSHPINTSVPQVRGSGRQLHCRSARLDKVGHLILPVVNCANTWSSLDRTIPDTGRSASLRTLKVVQFLGCPPGCSYDDCSATPLLLPFRGRRLVFVMICARSS